jgi:VCBS repeat protein
MAVPPFTRTIIGELDNSAATAMNTLFTVGDVNQDGFVDILVSGRDGRMAWFENPGRVGPWQRHFVDEAVEKLECGGLFYDLNGDRYPDLINGGDYRSDAVHWWENPGPKGGPWTRRTLARTGSPQFHDELIGDVTGDGRQSLIFGNQGGRAIYWLPLPDDPLAVWPEPRQIVADLGAHEEGLALADLDGDGKNELIAGTYWYKYRGDDRPWDQHRIAEDYVSTLVAVGDIDGDGRSEVLFSEGDACIYGKPQGGKFAWFRPKEDMTQLWEEHLVEDFLLDPHSLQLGDLCGNGHLDVLVGEIGVKERYEEKPPRLMIYENDGRGNFTRHIIDEGTGTHHARLVDFRNRGVLDIASRPLHGPEKWLVHVWYNSRGGPVE